MKILVLYCSLFFLSGCDQPTLEKDTAVLKIATVDEAAKKSSTDEIINHHHLSKATVPSDSIESIDYQEIDWIDLIPQTDLDALLNPPEYIMNVEEGTAEDKLVVKKPSEINTEHSALNDYEKALTSTDIIEAMDGKYIEIPGYIVPVAFNDDQIVTSFFLVPYFGACLHMPPPPPNQIIYIEIEGGFMLEEFYEPVVVAGQLSVALFEDQIASSAYSMTMDKMRLYYDN